MKSNAYLQKRAQQNGLRRWRIQQLVAAKFSKHDERGGPRAALFAFVQGAVPASPQRLTGVARGGMARRLCSSARDAAVDQLSMEAATFAGVLGAIVGSFLNVVVYRLPRHESLITPASHCPRCGTPVKPYDNIPILSWLLLRGHCRSCGAPISAALSARRGAHRRAVCRGRARAQLGCRDRAERAC